ncbi:hypothetical protein BZA05DRAFT_224527 [Tricharina praecox]|uniref:uncharacterized protein n=1 Tax=Tricharina praecox TaxID=43433 RepID=UPI0022202767|nr:uncharacterized protein BZA05DRAFT_224527 [Tricharina praecox]KAI5856029.1 hypothetical protein BZA05DRAFT_224527 [Tricharina praecox]
MLLSYRHTFIHTRHMRGYIRYIRYLPSRPRYVKPRPDPCQRQACMKLGSVTYDRFSIPVSLPARERGNRAGRSGAPFLSLQFLPLFPSGRGGKQPSPGLDSAGDDVNRPGTNAGLLKGFLSSFRFLFLFLFLIFTLRRRGGMYIEYGARARAVAVMLIFADYIGT